MIPPITGAEQYVRPDGGLTWAGQQLLQEMRSKIEGLEARLDAIAAVTAPSGGATVDAEARAAVDDIITAAGA